ncbi:MAG TPA: hypothetical protein VJV79_29725 [Polyangiaceae bacterium]|nr:hypothetical protein [Polyangiaceae bacterium]
MKRALIVGFLILAACDKKEAPVASDSAVVAASAPTPAPPTPVATVAPVIDIDSLPVEEDFESEAEKELTLASLNTQLDALDKEISAP